MVTAGLHFQLTDATFSSYWPPISVLSIQKLLSERNGLGACSRPAAMLRRGYKCTMGGEKSVPPEQVQEVFWEQFSVDTAQPSHSRRRKPTLPCPDSRHKESMVPLWMDNQHKPAWVDAESAPTEPCSKTISETQSSRVQGPKGRVATEGLSEVRKCRKLCEDGILPHAVDAVELLVERGCQVPSDLFYRVLKRCVQNKDLALGKRIHALIVKGGYKGNAFLATHLISFYASHRMLEEAMEVFTEVPKPDAYNWATIILAYAKQGEAAEAAKAIGLYRKMCESTVVKPDDRLYSAVLKACATAKDLLAGKEVHAHVLKSPGKPDKFVQAGLVNMYAQCGSLEDARRVFDNVSERNVVTWTAMIAGYAQRGMGHEALSLYKSMQKEGLTVPNSVTYVCLLQACASIGVGALEEGKQLHAEVREHGLQGNVVLGGSLVNMYAKCGSLRDARALFDELPERNIVAWTAMIAGYAQQGMGEKALDLFKSMQQEGLTPNSVTYICLLQACASVGEGALDEGKELHGEIEKRGLQEDLVLGVTLVNMYAKCGSLDDARRLFDNLPERNTVAWSAMISGYAQKGMGREALSLYSDMQKEGLTPDSVTYVCLLQACTSIGVKALGDGKQIHAQIKEEGLEEDVVLGGSLVNMYAKCGDLEAARSVFELLPKRNLVAWNAMITGCAQQETGQDALILYSKMQQEGVAPDCFTYASLLQACASLGVAALREGKELHAAIEERGLQQDLILGSSLVNMYAKCGRLQEARKVFDSLSNRDVVTWNAMIAGYAQQDMGEEAFTLYRSMRLDGLTPGCATYVSLLQACGSIGVGALVEGKHLHAQIEEQGMEEDAVLGGSLVNMYVKCGSLKDARSVFDKLPEKNLVAWTTMIAGCAEQGMGEEALTLYRSMQLEGLTPNSFTYVSLLQACAAVAALPLGEQLHAEMEARGLQINGIVGSALVNMYAKCGSMYDSQRVFDSLCERSIEAWGALVSGYAHLGDSQIVFDLLGRMKSEGIQPDEITFLSVLTVCSHVGLVDKGREYFNAMKKEYGISPIMEHYVCMVDLLGRAGHLEEALQLAKNMPFPPNYVVWHTLLGACWKWKNVEIGQQAFQYAVNMDKNDAASYVLMANIYVSTEMREEATEMQTRRVKLGAWKKPGQSWWTDMGGVVHTFLSGDKKHPESSGIYARLEQLMPKLKKEGYVPHLQSSLLGLSDDEKEAELCGHSEKLAIAYALNKTTEGTTIRIVKNLRVCEDCHTATAYISNVEKRTIICRDANRFHIFKEGKCMCGDYW